MEPLPIDTVWEVSDGYSSLGFYASYPLAEQTVKFWKEWQELEHSQVKYTYKIEQHPLRWKAPTFEMYGVKKG